MRFDLTWREGRDAKRRVVEALTSDEAVRKLAQDLDHPPELAYEVEPEDDLGYIWRRGLPGRARSLEPA